MDFFVNLKPFYWNLFFSFPMKTTFVHASLYAIIFLLAFFSFLIVAVTILSAVLNELGGKVVVEAGLIEHAQITICYIPRHDHLQSIN